MTQQVQSVNLAVFCRSGPNVEGKKNSISRAADDTLSEPCTAFSVLSLPNLALKLVGADLRASALSVGPTTSRHFPMASLPINSNATTGPLVMKLTNVLWKEQGETLFAMLVHCKSNL